MRGWWALLVPALLAACVSVGVGNDPPLRVSLLLHDSTTAAPRRAAPLVDALLIQPMPGDAVADTVAIAYSRQANEFAFYQFATWTERPVRQVPRLLQRRLDARGVAGTVGAIGDPLHADRVLAVSVDAMYHDVAAAPGQARFALTAQLFDRRSRTRIAHRQFVAAAPVARADAPAAAAAMSLALAQVFDELVPWLEAELAREPQSR